MKFGAQWSVKGIRPEARESAQKAARRSGMSLGDWLNSVILNSAEGEEDQYDEQDGQDIAALHGRLDELNRRIEQLTRRGPEAYAPPHLRYAARHSGGALAPPLAPLDPLRAAPPAPPAWRDEIAARRRALNGELAPQAMAPMPPPPAMASPAMAPEPMPQAVMRAPTPAQDLSGLEEQLRQITDRIDTLRTPGVEDAINALRGELAEIGHSLNDAMPRQAIDAIERQIQSLSTRIAEGRQAGVDGGALGGIEQGLAEVRDALYRLTPAENLAGFGEAIQTLDQKLDYIVAQKDPATLQQLEESINTLRQVATHIASNDAVSQVASDVAMLAEKIDRIAHTTPESALSGLEQRIAALSDAIAVRNQSGATVPPKLEALVGSLTDKIEKLQNSRGDNVAFGHLEDRIVKLVEKLDASDSRLAHLETIERGLADLLVNVETMRKQKGENGAGHGGNVDVLKDDIARTQNEIVAVHGKLGQVVDRLAMIEQGLLGVREAEAPTRMPGKLAVRAVTEEHAASGEPAPSLRPATPQPSAQPAAAPRAQQAPAPSQSAAEPVKRPLPRVKTLPIDPDLPPDQPIEPNSGMARLRLDPAARIAASEAALAGVASPSADAPQTKSGFIAAARRAAQAALRDKTTRPAPVQAPMADDDAGAKRGLTGRLSRRIKSLFIAASVIAIVIGSLQIGSTYFGLFGANDSKPAAQIQPAPGEEETQSAESAAGPAAAPSAAATQLPGMIPQSSPYGFSGPQVAPAVTPPSMSPADTTGALSPAQRYRPTTSAPAVTAPQSTPAQELPIAIGGAELRNAARNGDPAAAYEIAVRFAEGHGIAASTADAARWFERAARAGLAPAQFRLGSAYEKGQGVKKDLEKARHNYAAAAAQGNAKAMHNLAVLYAEGLSGKPDFTSASQWFKKAAAHGVADSEYNLAVLYARGLGVEKSFAESYKWFALAAAQGDKEAAHKRDDVASQLDAKELAAVKEAVRTFTALPQPAAATTVPQPAGGWDAAAPAAPREPLPKARASTGIKIGRK